MYIIMSLANYINPAGVVEFSKLELRLDPTEGDDAAQYKDTFEYNSRSNAAYLSTYDNSNNGVLLPTIPLYSAETMVVEEDQRLSGQITYYKSGSNKFNQILTWWDASDNPTNTSSVQIVEWTFDPSSNTHQPEEPGQFILNFENLIVPPSAIAIGVAIEILDGASMQVTWVSGSTTIKNTMSEQTNPSYDMVVTQKILGGGGTTGAISQLEADVSALQANKLNVSGGTMAGDLDMGGQKITNLASIEGFTTNINSNVVYIGMEATDTSNARMTLSGAGSGDLYIQPPTEACVRFAPNESSSYALSVDFSGSANVDITAPLTCTTIVASDSVNVYSEAYGMGTIDSGLNLYGTNDEGINFEVQDVSNAMRIGADGSIGIGTTTPTATLDISGTCIVSGGETTFDGVDGNGNSVYVNGGNLSMNNKRITTLAQPSMPSDAATKSYVDSHSGTQTTGWYEYYHGPKWEFAGQNGTGDGYAQKFVKIDPSLYSSSCVVEVSMYGNLIGYVEGHAGFPPDNHMSCLVTLLSWNSGTAVPSVAPDISGSILTNSTRNITTTNNPTTDATFGYFPFYYKSIFPITDILPGDDGFAFATKIDWYINQTYPMAVFGFTLHAKVYEGAAIAQ